MRTLIVHNPLSGFGSDAIFEFERALLSSGDECVFRMLPKTGGAKSCLKDADDFDAVVISGGDGTVTGLLYELRTSNVPVCIFPSGTANLFFENVGNATEPAALAHACRQAVCAQTDLGELTWSDTTGARHTRGFGLMAGFGFDAQLMAAAVPNKKALGEAAYFAAALANPRPSVEDFVIEVDGERYERRGICCMVANSATIQREIEVVPDCSITDGKIDVIVLETSDAVHLLRPVVAGLVDHRGTSLGRPYVEHFSGKNIRVSSSKPLPFQVDGEIFEGDVQSYEARVLPHCTNLIVDKLSPYYPQDAKGNTSAQNSADAHAQAHAHE